MKHRMDFWHFEFKASPLAPRDMVYVLGTKQKKVNGTTQTTFGSASVSNEWAEKALGATLMLATNKVRSDNMFPAVIRVTVTEKRLPW